MSEDIAKNPAIASVEFLLGKWRSTKAIAFYPTITTTPYVEYMEFTHDGQPVLFYNSTTTHAEKGQPLHSERGFLRINSDGKQLAFIVAHHFGLAEISEGEVNGNKVTLESKELHGMSFIEGNHTTKVTRFFELNDDDTLTSLVSLGTTHDPLQEHLRVTFKRV